MRKEEAMAQIPIALQMYTLREETARDFVGTLRKVAEIGYAGVEFAGTGGLTAQELQRLLDDLGLRPAGSHTGLDELERNLNAALDFSQAIGNSVIVCPYLPENRRRSADAYRAVAELLNRVGGACREHGLQLCYHNHDFEFQQFDGQYGLDILLGATDRELVELELDTYWVKKAGEDPVAYIRKYAGRCPLIHLKDMAADEKGSFAEVGEGTMDWPAIFAAAEPAGARWYIVEQDTCRRPPLESVAISLRNLRAMGKA
jgi:sugar phosphate isomerase/epimerase